MAVYNEKYFSFVFSYVKLLLKKKCHLWIIGHDSHGYPTSEGKDVIPQETTHWACSLPSASLILVLLALIENFAILSPSRY